MNGLNYGETKHVHGELDAIFTSAFMTTMVKNPNKTISTAWKPAFEGILNAYLKTAHRIYSKRENTLR